jgi:hypothetical protein
VSYTQAKRLAREGHAPQVRSEVQDGLRQNGHGWSSDRSNFKGTLPQTERRNFSAVGYDEAMRRARQMVPILRERAARSEDARVLIRENEQLLHESGLLRFHQPRSFGEWSSISSRWWTFRRSSRAAARPRRGTWAISAAIIGSWATTTPRPSMKSGTRTRTR